MNKLSALASSFEKQVDKQSDLINAIQSNKGFKLDGVLTLEELHIIIKAFAKIKLPLLPSFIVGWVLKPADPIFKKLLPYVNSTLTFVKEGKVKLKEILN